MTGQQPKRREEGARPIAVDLFSGAGGMSLGFEQAGFDILAAVDSDPVHLAVHERNFPLTQAVCVDVAALTASALESNIRKGWTLHGRDGEWDGTIDCLFGGPSCQGFSDMGKQVVDDDRNELVMAFARLVGDLRPRTFVMENVPGLLFPKVRPLLDRLLEQLRSHGYTLQADPPACHDAADFGVPQRRRRVFVVGSLDANAVPRLPCRIGGPTVAMAIDDLPDVDRVAALMSSGRLALTPSQERELWVKASSYVRSLRMRRGLEYERVWASNILTGCQRTEHSADVRARFRKLRPGQEDPVGRTARLAATGRAPTLRAGTGRDHGSFTATRPIHHRWARVITVREAARLHSFPDWFAFHEAKWHALREIGNSVPPRLAASIARTVRRALGAGSTRPTVAVTLGADELLRMSLHEAADYYGVPRAALPSDVRRARSAV